MNGACTLKLYLLRSTTHWVSVHSLCTCFVWRLPFTESVRCPLCSLECDVCMCSVHEVYIDDEQLCWFESVLQHNRDRPIIIFTHAPPMGSGLKVVQNVHVKNRCAWLNHSDR